MVVFPWIQSPGAHNEGYLVQLAARGEAHNGAKGFGCLAKAAFAVKKTLTVTVVKQLADVINRDSIIDCRCFTRGDVEKQDRKILEHSKTFSK